MLKRSIALCKIVCPWDKNHGACFCLVYSYVLFYVCIWGKNYHFSDYENKWKMVSLFIFGLRNFWAHDCSSIMYSLYFDYILEIIHIAVKIVLEQECAWCYLVKTYGEYSFLCENINSNIKKRLSSRRHFFTMTCYSDIRYFNWW